MGKILRIFIGLTLLISLPSHGATVNDAEWYRREMINRVVPLYSAAYRMLHDDIIQRILQFDDTPNQWTTVENNETTENPPAYYEEIDPATMINETTTWNDLNETTTEVTGLVQSEQQRLGSLVKQLGAAATGVYDRLKNASHHCEQLRKEVSDRIAIAVLSISKQEEELNQIQSKISSLVAAIHVGEQQVTFAEQVVRERETAVHNAEHALREAQRRVEKARVCRGRRRKKRFIGGWWRKNVERPVVKAFCSVANMGGIDSAKEARGTAEHNLNDARNRLSSQRQELQNRRIELSQTQNRRQIANAEREVLRNQLSTMQNTYAAISSLFERFQLVQVHLSEVFRSSETLKIEIKRLLSFELVIEPLKALAERMIKDQLLPSFNFDISATTVAQVDRILDRLSEKLDRMPAFIENPVFLKDNTD